MNYQQRDILDQLAGGYVLGTLGGRARARFERLCADQPLAQAALHRWEDRLMPLQSKLVPVVPSNRVWEQIVQRIQHRASPVPRARWRWALVGALAMTLVIGISIRWHTPRFEPLAALGQDVAHPLWSVSRSKDSAALTIVALQKVSTQPQRAYELWALPRSGKAPVSLGLLPRSGRFERSLTAVQRDALLSASW